MIIVPMPWHAVPADSTVILSNGRYAHVSGMLDVYGCRLIDGVPDYPNGIAPVVVYSDAELTAQLGTAIATIARYFTIESVTVEGS